jgi:hypothetical protein
MKSSENTGSASVEKAAAPFAKLLATSETMAGFLQSAGILTLDERRVIVDQAITVLEQNYVHLPMKKSMYAADPAQRLRLLGRRLEQQVSDTMPPEWIFHSEITDIFNSVRDLHTSYHLPQPYAGKLAYLPFKIEECTSDQGSQYLVTHVVQGFTAPGFERGASVTHWSGIPIATAVDLNGARFAGGNAASRRSRGLESLTIRPLVILLPPYEDWATISYIDRDGNHLQLQEPWRVVENLPPFVDASDTSAAAEFQGVDFGTDAASRAKILLFAPHLIDRQRNDSAAGSGGTTAHEGVPSTMPRLFRARTVDTPSGTFGHIRIFSFGTSDPQAFVREFVRLIELLPQNGLIVDVRDNGGGSITASESLLQALGPRRVSPEPAQFLNTPINLSICRTHMNGPPFALGPWVRSMEQAVETGAVFSNSFPLTSDADANSLGQRYFGPVVLVTNARCYSATDMFAAGFQDHEIGPVLGVDDNTGAGGANVWTHSVLRALVEGVQGSPYSVLPGGAEISVAMRRTLRVGKLTGTPVEDLGIIPEQVHRMTRDDVLEDNRDLLGRAGQILKSQPKHNFVITEVARCNGSVRIVLDTDEVDRLDFYLDQRPRSSADVVDGHAEVTIEKTATAELIRVEGFDHGRLVATRSARLPRVP